MKKDKEAEQYEAVFTILDTAIDAAYELIVPSGAGAAVLNSMLRRMNIAIRDEKSQGNAQVVRNLRQQVGGIKLLQTAMIHMAGHEIDAKERTKVRGSQP